MRPGPALRWRASLALSGILVAAACGPAQGPPASAASRQDEAAYLPPPSIDRMAPAPGGLLVDGAAAPGAGVRLASPGGDGLAATADASGRWRLSVPMPDGPRIFGLSQTQSGRTTQAEGYVFLSPEGRGWLLRAGAAARPLGTASAGGMVVDHDRNGGAVISGRGPADALLVAQVDGRRAGEARTDASGRFEIRLNGPAPTGESRLRVFGEGLNLETLLRVSPPAPLDAGPMRVVVQGQGLRIDWLTPGGGIQTTQILP